MADLGAIGRALMPVVAEKFTVPTPTARKMTLSPESKVYSPAGPMKVVGGTVRVLGNLTPNRVVRVYDHDSGAFLYETKSDGSGNWSCPSLGATKILAVAMGDGTYNAQVYDMITPD